VTVLQSYNHSNGDQVPDAKTLSTEDSVYKQHMTWKISVTINGDRGAG